MFFFSNVKSDGITPLSRIFRDKGDTTDTTHTFDFRHKIEYILDTCLLTMP